MAKRSKIYTNSRLLPNKTILSDTGNDREALMIHGLNYGDYSSPDSDDSGASSLDENYFKYTPGPIPLDADNVIIIKPLKANNDVNTTYTLGDVQEVDKVQKTNSLQFVGDISSNTKLGTKRKEGVNGQNNLPFEYVKTKQKPKKRNKRNKNPNEQQLAALESSILKPKKEDKNRIPSSNSQSSMLKVSTREDKLPILPSINCTTSQTKIMPNLASSKRVLPHDICPVQASLSKIPKLYSNSSQNKMENPITTISGSSCNDVYRNSQVPEFSTVYTLNTHVNCLSSTMPNSYHNLPSRSHNNIAAVQPSTANMNSSAQYSNTLQNGTKRSIVNPISSRSNSFSGNSEGYGFTTISVRNTHIKSSLLKDDKAPLTEGSSKIDNSTAAIHSSISNANSLPYYIDHTLKNETKSPIATISSNYNTFDSQGQGLLCERILSHNTLATIRSSGANARLTSQEILSLFNTRLANVATANRLPTYTNQASTRNINNIHNNISNIPTVTNTDIPQSSNYKLGNKNIIPRPKPTSSVNVPQCDLTPTPKRQTHDTVIKPPNQIHGSGIPVNIPQPTVDEETGLMERIWMALLRFVCCLPLYLL